MTKRSTKRKPDSHKGWYPTRIRAVFVNQHEIDWPLFVACLKLLCAEDPRVLAYQLGCTYMTAEAMLAGHVAPTLFLRACGAMRLDPIKFQRGEELIHFAQPWRPYSGAIGPKRKTDGDPQLVKQRERERKSRVHKPF
jgi:hypothetical protein